MSTEASTSTAAVPAIVPPSNLSPAEVLVRAMKTVCTVWVAATSDEVHSTQGLLEAQGDSQRLGN